MGQLTRELRHAVLIRHHADGSCELVGSSKGVGYRYSIRASGTSQLIETRTLSNISPRARNLLYGIGSATTSVGVGAAIWALAGHATWPGWFILLIWIGICVLGGAHIAYDGNLMTMRGDPDSWDSWYEYGSGWGE